MIESYQDALEELKRADHLLYVSLKYTRTADVIMSVIKRLLATFEFSVESLLRYYKKEGKVEEIPQNPIQRANSLKKIFIENTEMIELLETYMLLRRISRAEYIGSHEFRKNVTMTATIGDDIYEVNMEKVAEFYEKTKTFIQLVRKIITA
jgi:hypothetical protein